MSGSFGAFHPNIEKKEVGEVAHKLDNQMEQNTPSIDELRSKLKELFPMPPDLPREMPEKRPEGTQASEQKPGTITLDDGTLIELPDPTCNMRREDGEKTETEKNRTEHERNDTSAEPVENAKEGSSEDIHESHAGDSVESDIENTDPTLEKIEKALGTIDGMKELLERHPELKEKLETLIDILNDPDTTPAEKNNADIQLKKMKGALLEAAVKDALQDAGLDVEQQQRQVEGENGGTRPDVIATNNTDKPITVLGVTINPGETISIECKCGSKSYLSRELNDHIPNQLSGHIGNSVLVTTSDIQDVKEKAEGVCDSKNATLVSTDISAADVEKTMREVLCA